MLIPQHIVAAKTLLHRCMFLLKSIRLFKSYLLDYFAEMILQYDQ